MPPFGGGALRPVVVSRLSPGTQWAPLRRERVPSPLDRRGRRGGRVRRRALSMRVEMQSRRVDGVAGDEVDAVSYRLDGPGPQPGNPGVISVLCIHIVQNVRESGRIGRNGRSGCCRGCCHGPRPGRYAPGCACRQGAGEAARLLMAAIPMRRMGRTGRSPVWPASSRPIRRPTSPVRSGASTAAWTCERRRRARRRSRRASRAPAWR